MRKGVVQQVGTPLDLYNHPANRFVARFIGSSGMNFTSCDIVEDQRRLRMDVSVGNHTLTAIEPAHTLAKSRGSHQSGRQIGIFSQDPFTKGE